jgi:uncharacterized membrane protein
MAEINPNSRLEAFCDGVFAIALTLLIIDIKIPSSTEINNTSDFWQALKHISPAIFAFILSFIIILITWVNHHNSIKLIDKSSNAFIYSNGFLLFTVVFVPFPTSLLGEFLMTDHASPAVVLYDSVLAFQAISWILLLRSALRGNLCRNEKSIQAIRANLKFGYFALVLYSACAITAIWFPFTIAMITTVSWIFWLIWGIKIKHV